MNRLGVVAVVAGCAFVAGCTGSAPLTAPTVGPVGTSGVNGAAVLHAAALDRGSLRAATLDVASGATTVDIKAAPLAGKLVTVLTPPTSGQQPALALSADGVATLQLTSPGVAGGPSVVDVVLDASVAWTIDLDGGATEAQVDMRGGHLAVLDLATGVSRASIELPATSGTQLVRETGGASVLTVQVPAVVATRVHVVGGASSVTIGGTTHSGVGAPQTFNDPRYASSSQRLDLELTGGVSSVTVS